MRAQQSVVWLLFLLCVSFLAPASAQTSGGSAPSQSKPSSEPVEIPLTTATRIERAGNAWWPTKKAGAPSDFVGDHACASCHQQKTASQIATPMAQAARLVQDATLLRDHPALSATRSGYSYSLSKAGDGFSYSVSDRSATVSGVISWAMGLGNKGQTYLYFKDGAYYESEMSYYAAISALDVTTGHEHKRPNNLDEALGDRLDAHATEKCFGCHATGATTVSGGFAPQNATPGVTCEACHGPGSAHVVLMQQLQGETAPTGDLRIFNPHSLVPVASVDFCGACHRTSSDVFELHISGPVLARFQPYGLENSKCWGDGDARLTCMACHDPHQQLEHEAGWYDQKCLACHPATKAAQKFRGPDACPVAKQNCVTCHMAKTNLPVMHTAFTDHQIRVVR